MTFPSAKNLFYTFTIRTPKNNLDTLTFKHHARSRDFFTRHDASSLLSLNDFQLNFALPVGKQRARERGLKLAETRSELRSLRLVFGNADVKLLILYGSSACAFAHTCLLNSTVTSSLPTKQAFNRNDETTANVVVSFLLQYSKRKANSDNMNLTVLNVLTAPHLQLSTGPVTGQLATGGRSY